MSKLAPAYGEVPDFATAATIGRERRIALLIALGMLGVFALEMRLGHRVSADFQDSWQHLSGQFS